MLCCNNPCWLSKFQHYFFFFSCYIYAIYNVRNLCSSTSIPLPHHHSFPQLILFYLYRFPFALSKPPQKWAHYKQNWKVSFEVSFFSFLFFSVFVGFLGAILMDCVWFCFGGLQIQCLCYFVFLFSIFNCYVIYSYSCFTSFFSFSFFIIGFYLFKLFMSDCLKIWYVFFYVFSSCASHVFVKNPSNKKHLHINFNKTTPSLRPECSIPSKVFLLFMEWPVNRHYLFLHIHLI